MRNFCIANTKSHIPYTDLIVLISQILILYFLSNRFWFQNVIEFVRLFRIKGCMLTIKLSLYGKYILVHVCTGTIDFGFYLTGLLKYLYMIIGRYVPEMKQDRYPCTSNREKKVWKQVQIFFFGQWFLKINKLSYLDWISK